MQRNIDRQIDSEDLKRYLIISKRLLRFVVFSLLATAAVFALSLYFEKRLMISWLVFECGIIGGFVSIQQRLRTLGSEELALLSESWATILVVPIFGGVFAMVLYVLFLSGMLQGHLFPSFDIPEFSTPTTPEDVISFLRIYPSQGADIAKLLFWSFVAGFSERFVPQIVQQFAKQGDNAGGGKSNDSP